MKVPLPIRRHEFRYAPCARQTFMRSGVPAAGHMQVYFKSPIAEDDLKSGMPNAPASLS